MTNWDIKTLCTIAEDALKSGADLVDTLDTLSDCCYAIGIAEGKYSKFADDTAKLEREYIKNEKHC